MTKKNKNKIDWKLTGKKKIKIPKFAPRRPSGIVYPVYTAMSSSVTDLATPMGGPITSAPAVAAPAGGVGMGESVSGQSRAMFECESGESYMFETIDGIIHKAILFGEE
jgi:hypothetical protein